MPFVLSSMLLTLVALLRMEKLRLLTACGGGGKSWLVLATICGGVGERLSESKLVSDALMSFLFFR